MPTILIIIGLLAFAIITTILISYKSDRDRRIYSCYLRMMFKGIADVSGCQGTGTPECKHCYYHKLLNRKETNE